MRLDLDFLAKEWAVIVTAPYIAIGGILVIIIVTVLVMRFLHSREVANKNSHIAVLEERILLAKDDLNRPLATELESVKEKVATLETQIRAGTVIELGQAAGTTASVRSSLVNISIISDRVNQTLTLEPGGYGFTWGAAATGTSSTSDGKEEPVTLSTSDRKEEPK